MNLSQAAVVLRPRSVAEVLDLSFLVAGSRALGLYLRLSLLVLLPCFVVCMVLRYALGVSWWVVWLVAALLGSLAQGPFTLAVGQFLFTESISVGAVMRNFRKRFGAYLGALFISRFYLVASAMTLVLLPFAWTRVLFVHEAALLEMADANVAVKRSTRFVAGHGSQAFLMLVVLLVAHVGSVFLAQLLGDGIVDTVFQLGQPFGVLWRHGGSAYSVLGFFLALPYIATARFLLYIDRRTRSDGWDIQVRFMAIAADRESRK